MIDYNPVTNVQERASELYTPVHPSKEALICLNCPNKRCKPMNYKRYATELAKINENE